MSRKKTASRRGNKASPRKKARVRKGGAGRKATKRRSPGRSSGRPPRRPRLLGKLLLLACGLLVGLLVPWTLWLNHLVTSEFEGRRWDLPSRVYARPLSLFPGLRISRSALLTELESAGYQRVPAAESAGTFAVSGARFDVHRRAFRFEDGVQEAIRFEVRIEDGTVTRLASPAGGAPLSLVRLDPAEFASIYPSQAEDRTLVDLQDVPELLVTGLQAVEDRQFKHHHGVDPRGIARALVANVRAGGAVQGGSTLTQQLVKNYYLSNERTLLRKANEAIMALLLEAHYDKAEILEAYLNEVYLGQQGARAIHGFGRASEYYFGRSLSQLAPHQIALLVGMVRGASLYHPRRNPRRALERRNRVLDQFEETGLLSAEETARWKARPLDVTPEPGVGRNRYAAFVDLVRDQLARDYREQDLRTEGLRIFTTLSPSAQEAAQQALSGGLDELARRGLPADLQGAIVLAEVDSGEIRAVVGDRQPGRNGFNRALNARRQVGSVIKPLVYLLALEHSDDYHWLSTVEDRPVTLTQADGGSWTPANYDGRSHGEVSLLEALTRSYNQATVRLGMTLGVRHLIDKLRRLGVDRDIPAVPATLLGAVELTPLEVTQVYQSLASGGFSVPLRAVTAVQTPQGENLNRYALRYLPLDRREAVAVLNYGLTRVVAEGTAAALPKLLGREVLVAGKTGTTNERRDSWYVGYTRDLVGVAWVGLDDNRPAGVTGSNAAMRIWASLFRQLPLEPVSEDLPEGAQWLWVERSPVALSGSACPQAEQMPFVLGSEPTRRSDCGRGTERENSESFWRKWFDDD
jgi:penicillin-binding protein 1B